MPKSKLPGDPQLFARIRDIIIVTPNLNNYAKLADELRQTHPEYGRRKRREFISLVAKACSVLNIEPQFLPKNKALGSNQERKRKHSPPSPGSDSAALPGKDYDSSDLSDVDEETLVDYKDTNMPNSTLTSLYAKSVPPPKPLFDNDSPPYYIDTQPEDSSESGVGKSGQKISAKAKRIASAAAGVSGKSDSKSVNINGNNTGTGGPKFNRKRAATQAKIDDMLIEVPQTTFSAIGGCESQLLEACQNFILHLKQPTIYAQLGVAPPVGFLLHGPPGCGKSLFAAALCGEFELPMLKLAATELVSGVSGESEEAIRGLFERAKSVQPACVLFIDEIDAIAPRRETASREMEKRIVSQIIACLDELATATDIATGGGRVLVIGATSRPDTLEPALRRAGRFDKEITLGIPNVAEREKIMGVVCRGIKLNEAVSMRGLAKATPGYVGADLTALAREACIFGVDRVCRSLQKEFEPPAVTDISSNYKTLTDELERTKTWLKQIDSASFENLNDICVTMDDFNAALKVVTPSAKREGFATVPDVNWSDIGALQDVRSDLKWSILVPIKYPEKFEALGLSSRPQGVLLCGPPGCGKTLLAKAIANETGMNFISVKGPELLSMYVGESERAVRQVFQRARNSAPCVIFFDELDSLVPKRSESSDSGGSSVRVVNQMLTEMDGMESRKQVFLIGATNRPDIIDPAILRPGRLDKVVFVGFPNPADREDILKAVTKHGTKPQLHTDVDLASIARDPRIEWFSGADLAALVREASVAALRESMAQQMSTEVAPAAISNGEVTTKPKSGVENNFILSQDDDDKVVPLVKLQHFNEAFERIHPSVSEKERMRYENLRLKHNESLK